MLSYLKWDSFHKFPTVREISVSQSPVFISGWGKLLLPLAVLLAVVSQDVLRTWAGQGHWCEQVKTEAEQKRKRLNEYLQSLQASYDARDFRLADTLNYKIKQVKDELRILEQEAADCSAQRSESMRDGIRETKAEESRYAAKSCGELRSMILPLVRKTQALTRKEKSLLAGLTRDEKTELAEASEQLRAIGRILRTRCATPRARNSLLHRLRP